MHPILILLTGMAAILFAIIVLRLNAFLGLLGAAILVSLLAPGEAGLKIARVAEAFGRSAGNVGIVIALAAIIGMAMMKSGAADRIVQAFLDVLGEKRSATAFTASGLVLAIPVFFDTVFFLLVPLARSMYRRTGKHYLRYLLAIPAGGVVAHTLVPPTPGPLVVAATLGVDIGTMVLMGLLVAIPSATVGLLFAGWIDRRMPVPFREDPVAAPAIDATTPVALPGLFASVLPIILPVLLIAANTVAASMSSPPEAPANFWRGIAPYAALFGNPNMALTISATAALWIYARQRRPSRAEMADGVEAALMSGGLIILITAAGGAFGAMLQAAEIGPAIESWFSGRASLGLIYLFLGFTVSTLMKVAQGSTTVALITTAAMLFPMLETAGTLPFHTVYVALAIGSGGMVGVWMNDSGFWVFTKMGGLTELESLRSYTPLLAIVGVTAMAITVALAMLLPLT